MGRAELLNTCVPASIALALDTPHSVFHLSTATPLPCVLQPCQILGQRPDCVGGLADRQPPPGHASGRVPVPAATAQGWPGGGRRHRPGDSLSSGGGGGGGSCCSLPRQCGCPRHRQRQYGGGGGGGHANAPSAAAAAATAGILQYKGGRFAVRQEAAAGNGVNGGQAAVGGRTCCCYYVSGARWRRRDCLQQRYGGPTEGGRYA